MVGLLGGGTTLTCYPVPDPEVALPPPSGPNSLAHSCSLANPSKRMGRARL